MEVGVAASIEMPQNPLVKTDSLVSSSLEYEENEANKSRPGLEDELHDKVDTEAGLKTSIEMPQNPQVKTDNVVSFSFQHDENKPNKKKSPRLAEDKANGFTVKMHRVLSTRFTSNLSEGHTCKRSTKDIVRRNYHIGYLWPSLS